MTSGFDVTLVDVNRNQGYKEIQSDYSVETFSLGSNEKRLIFFHRPCRDVHLSLLILYWHGSESTVISKVMVTFDKRDGGIVVCDILPHQHMLLNRTHWSF